MKLTQKEFDRRFMNAGRMLWGMVVEEEESKRGEGRIIRKQKQQWEKMRTAALVAHFPTAMADNVWIVEGEKWIRNFQWDDLSLHFTHCFFFPFVEGVKLFSSRHYIAFLPEVNAFLKTRKLPCRLYGAQPSLEYYDAQIKKVNALRARIVKSKERFIKREEWKRAEYPYLYA